MPLFERNAINYFVEQTRGIDITVAPLHREVQLGADGERIKVLALQLLELTIGCRILAAAAGIKLLLSHKCKRERERES